MSGLTVIWVGTCLALAWVALCSIPLCALKMGARADRAIEGLERECPCLTPEEADLLWERVMAADEETF